MKSENINPSFLFHIFPQVSVCHIRQYHHGNACGLDAHTQDAEDVRVLEVDHY